MPCLLLIDSHFAIEACHLFSLIRALLISTPLPPCLLAAIDACRFVIALISPLMPIDY